MKSEHGRLLTVKVWTQFFDYTATRHGIATAELMQLEPMQVWCIVVTLSSIVIMTHTIVCKYVLPGHCGGYNFGSKKATNIMDCNVILNYK